MKQQWNTSTTLWRFTKKYNPIKKMQPYLKGFFFLFNLLNSKNQHNSSILRNEVNLSDVHWLNYYRNQFAIVIFSIVVLLATSCLRNALLWRVSVAFASLLTESHIKNFHFEFSHCSLFLLINIVYVHYE